MAAIKLDPAYSFENICFLLKLQNIYSQINYTNHILQMSPIITICAI